MKFSGILWIAFATVGVASAFIEAEYNYFDDYLSSIVDGEIKMTDEETEGSGDDEIFSNTNIRLPIRTGLKNNKESACCYLGHMAGDKGYHCVSKFYAARIMLRNQNRAHNRKMGFYGRFSVPNYGTKLMRTFEQCVATREMVFQKCCHFAVTEKRNTPHFDTLQRKRYEQKMKRIRFPRSLQVDDNFLGV